MNSENNKRGSGIVSTGDEKMPNGNRRYIIYVISGFLTLYGFLTLSNPEKYPLFGGIYDKALGLLFMIVGIVLFIRERE